MRLSPKNHYSYYYFIYFIYIDGTCIKIKKLLIGQNVNVCP